MDSHKMYNLMMLSLAFIVSCSAIRTDVCSLNKDVGPCDAVIPRWYFNSESMLCEQFDWGGCGGNANKYETKEECMRGCVCNLPSNSGLCEAAVPSWFYDVKTGRCKRFIWGGCFFGGNGNVFENECDCYKTCSGTKQRRRIKLWTVDVDYRSA